MSIVMQSTRFRPRLFWLLPLLVHAAAAQVVPTDEVVNLDTLVVGSARELPPTYASLTGLATDSLNIPRSTTLVTGAQLTVQSITRVEDLSIFIPGAVNAPPYGLTGVPLLRGDLGDAAQNGQRRAYNRNVFPVSFNSVESVEVIAGAPPSFFGYASGTGGLVNFLTKQPSLASSKSTLAASVGSWDTYRVQLDTMAPISRQLAYRLSIERSASKGFYRLIADRAWDAYLALTWQPAPSARWDFNAEGYWTTYAENPGTNRPTQALIDRGEYITGSSVQNGGTGGYFGNTFTPTGTVTLDGSQVLVAPGDGAWARGWNAQLTGSLQAGAGRQLVSRTYFESVASEKHSAYRFYSYVPRSYTLEQRLEVSERRDWGPVGHALTWGAALRGETRTSFVDFFNEAMNAFDLTLDPDTLRLPANRTSFVVPVPGRPGQFALRGARYGAPLSVGTSQTLHSRLFNGGLFAQDQVTLPNGFSLLLGVRGDELVVDSADPLAPAGTTPARDSLAKFLPSATASLQWQPRTDLAVYLTWNDAAAVEPSSSSGGFGLTGNRLPAVLFENRSRLVEAGAKGNSGDQRFAWSLALYRQERVRTNPRFNLPDEIFVQGIEAAFTHRPNQRVSLTGNFSYLDAHFQNGPLPGSVATVPYFDPTRPSDNFGAFTCANYRLPGLPRWTANLQAVVDLPGYWVLDLWGSAQGAQNLDLFGHTVIRAQHTFNAALTWQRRQWEWRFACLNFTDEFNWRPTSSPFAGADLVTRELPHRWRADLSYAF